MPHHPARKARRFSSGIPTFGILWDPVAGVRERDVLQWQKEFVETAKFGMASAQVWMNKQWGKPNLGGDCVHLTLPWLQAVMEQGFDLNIFCHAASLQAASNFAIQESAVKAHASQERRKRSSYNYYRGISSVAIRGSLERNGWNNARLVTNHFDSHGCAITL
ncbi:hypothetical protein B0H10DRAFT_1959942 [Mycena sp. CBHHK59/15]|nr:hypothetical protein B0H10DRAFT_1959942 [Mycena sp. CBHHK59/15]